MNVQYQRGYLAERWCKAELVEQGYTVVRAAGSKGPIDLVAIGKNDIRLIQVKRVAEGRPPSFAAEIASLRQVDVPPCAHKELWIWLDEKKEWVIAAV